MSDLKNQKTNGADASVHPVVMPPSWEVAWFPTYRQKQEMSGRLFWFHCGGEVVGPVRFVRYTKQGTAIVKHDEILAVNNQFANQKRGSVYHSTVIHCRLFTTPNQSA